MDKRDYKGSQHLGAHALTFDHSFQDAFRGARARPPKAPAKQELLQQSRPAHWVLRTADDEQSRKLQASASLSCLL